MSPSLWTPVDTPGGDRGRPREARRQTPRGQAPASKRTCRSAHGLAGSRRAAPRRSLARCGAHPVDVTHVAQRPTRGSGAQRQALPLRPRRRATTGGPRAPAVRAHARAMGHHGCDWGVVRERRAACPLAGCPQGSPAMPLLVGDGRRERCRVVATVRADDSRTRSIGPVRVVQPTFKGVWLGMRNFSITTITSNTQEAPHRADPMIDVFTSKPQKSLDVRNV